MKTKIDIISGFLGSGKTTLIAKLLEDIKDTQPIAIIENEFGTVGIDGSILKRSGNVIKEINSGCICCTLAGSFETALEDMIRDYNPSRIIIEPSGVAKLSDVISSINSPFLKETTDLNIVATVVDATKLNLYLRNFGDFFKNQLKHGKVIFLNRTELIPMIKQEEIIDTIRSINEKAIIVSTPLEELSPSQLVYLSENGDEEYEITKVIVKIKTKKQIAGDTFQSFSKDYTGILSHKRLEEFLESISDEEKYGRILRAKGIVQTDEGWKSFDYVPSKYVIKDYFVDYGSRVCIIGTGLKDEALNNMLKEGNLYE